MSVKDKNILYVLPAVQREGISVLTLQQIKALTDRGHIIFLVVLGPCQKQVMQNIGVSLPPCRILLLNGKDSYLSVQALLTSLLLIRPIQNFIKNNGIEVVIAHAPYSHFIVRLVAKLGLFKKIRPKFLQYFHMTQYEQFPLISYKRKCINLLNIKLAHTCDDVHVSVSEAVKQDTQNGLISLKPHIVLLNAVLVQNHHGSSLPSKLKDWLKHNEEYTIFLPGRLCQMKGQVFFLKIFEAFLQRLPAQESVKLIISGEGSDKEDLTTLIRTKSLMDNVRLISSLDRKHVISLMKKADLVVVPSNFEGFGLVALEAMQQGAQVLSSDAGGLKEVVIDGVTGWTFRKGDKEDCLNKLTYLYRNRHLNLLDLKQLQRIISTKFSFEEHINKLEQIILDSIEKK